MRLHLCIVGCGEYARTVLGHTGDMTEHLGFYFASRDAQKAKDYCEEFGGIDYFGSYEEAAADPRVEAMYFVTPHDLHLPNAEMAARHSKHILMEKPIARTVPEAMGIIEAARDAGVKLMVAENYRFLPTVNKCKELIRDGVIGDIRLVQIESTGYGEVDRWPWRVSVERCGGGRFIDGGIHDVDILLNVAGFPETVFATKPVHVLPDLEGEDGLVMMARLPGGAVGAINFSNATPVPEWQRWVHVTGTKGELQFDQWEPEVHILDRESRRVVKVPEVRNAWRAMVKEFRDSVVEDREPLMSGQEAINDLAVVLAAYESADTGKQVQPCMPDVGGSRGS